MRSEVLSSDILEQQFGPTEVVVLYQDAATRVIATRVKASGQTLELSRVAFVKAGVEEFAKVHQAVAGGLSMGKAFRQASIEFVRETRAAYQQVLPANFARWFGDHEPATVVSVSILVGPARTPYAEIMETYSPLVKWPQQTGHPSAEDSSALHMLDEFLSSL